jgi:outer membrane protein assembly factor BamA
MARRFFPNISGYKQHPATRFVLPIISFAFLLIIGSELSGQEAIPIASIVFEGNKAISTARLKNCFRTSVEGNPYTAAVLESDLQYVRELYADEGFLKAIVGTPRVEIQSSNAKKSAVIRIPITEGPSYNLKTMSVKNLHALPADTFIQMSPLAAGKPFSRIKAAQWQAKIVDAYHAIGYLNFRCTANENINEKSGSVDFVLDCAEGSPYSVGKIKIVGDPSINAAEFKRRLLVSEGGLFNPELLAYSIQFVNELRIYRPIANSDVEIRTDDKTCTVDITWHLASLPKSVE